jgi:hypothetical protein
VIYAEYVVEMARLVWGVMEKLIVIRRRMHVESVEEIAQKMISLIVVIIQMLQR